ncbi:MAG: hypothetical protein ACUVX1_16185 [Chloroflexota bacterium]
MDSLRTVERVASARPPLIGAFGASSEEEEAVKPTSDVERRACDRPQLQAPIIATT